MESEEEVRRSDLQDGRLEVLTNERRREGGKEGKAGDGDGGVWDRAREREGGREDERRQTARETGQEVGARPAASGKAGPPC